VFGNQRFMIAGGALQGGQGGAVTQVAKRDV